MTLIGRGSASNAGAFLQNVDAGAADAGGAEAANDGLRRHYIAQRITASHADIRR